MHLIKNGFRKAGEYAREHPVITSLLAGGSVLGTAGVLQKLSQDEQEAVLEAAIAAENEGGGEVLGLSSGGLLGAAVVLGILDEEGDDILKRVVTTTPGNEREYSTVMGTTQYRDPMGSRRYEAMDRGIQRIKGPVPQHIIKGRRNY